MSISPPALPSGPRSPTPDRVVPGIQFSWGRLISRVSSIDTILAPGRMNSAALLSVAVEDDVRLDRLVLLVEHEERDAGPVAGDVFDPQVRHEDVDRAVADEVADDVVDDLVLRRGLEAYTPGADERVDGFLDVFLLVLLRHLLPFVLEGAVQGVLDHVQELLLPRVEVGLPDFVDVLRPIVIVEDSGVREGLADRHHLDLLEGVAGQVGDSGQVRSAAPGPFGLLLDPAAWHHHLASLRHLGHLRTAPGSSRRRR